MAEDEKLQDLLRLLLNEIELQGSKTITIEYKKFEDIFMGDSGEIEKYLGYLQRKSLVKLIDVKKVQVMLFSKSYGWWEEEAAKKSASKYLFTYNKSKIQQLEKSLYPTEKELENKQPLKKVNLKSVSITYDDDKPSIQINKQPVPLPPYKNEHYLCRAIFQYPAKEFIDWSIIFEAMDKVLNSTSKKDSQKDKRMVQDAMYAVNNRIKEVINTDDDLFTWKEKSIRRNY